MPDLESPSIPDASRRDALKLAGALALGGVAGVLTSAGDAHAAGGPRATVTSFQVEIDGSVVQGLESVEGIEGEVNVVEFRGGDGAVHFVQGAPKPPRMLLTRTWNLRAEFLHWWQMVGRGDFVKGLSIVFLDAAGQEVQRLNFSDCWPTKWIGPSMDAQNSGHPTESLEIVWESVALA